MPIRVRPLQSDDHLPKLDLNPFPALIIRQKRADAFAEEGFALLICRHMPPKRLFDEPQTRAAQACHFGGPIDSPMQGDMPPPIGKMGIGREECHLLARSDTRISAFS